MIDPTGLRRVFEELQLNAGITEEEFNIVCDEAVKDIDENKDGLISREEFYQWYETSDFWKAKNKNITDEAITPAASKAINPTLTLTLTLRHRSGQSFYCRRCR